MDDFFDSLRAVGDQAVLPTADTVRARGRQRQLRARALYGMTAAAVVVAGVTAGAALAGGGTNRAVIDPSTQTPTAAPTAAPTASPTLPVGPTAVPSHRVVLPTATHAPAPPPVCQGVADCHPDGTADMDGDGVQDTIAVVGHPKKDPYGGYYWQSAPAPPPVLRVRTATAIFTYRVRLDGPVYGHVVLGAAHVDGVAGQEVVVGFADGAHGYEATMMTVRGGQLVALPAPNPFRLDLPREGSWGSDGSLSHNMGWHCVSAGVVEQYESFSSGPAGTGTYTWTHQRWRWSSGHWVKVGVLVTTHRAPPASAAKRYSGWTGCGTVTEERPYVGTP